MKQHFNRIALAGLLAGGLSGCGGEPEWVAVYEDCKEKMTGASEQLKSKTESAGEENPQAKAMLGAMGNMAMSMGMAACESIKQVCEPDPDGGTCEVIVKEYKKNKDK